MPKEFDPFDDDPEEEDDENREEASRLTSLTMRKMIGDCFMINL